MTSDFDRLDESYRDEVAEAIRFIGREPEFFTRIKADYLVELAERHLAPAQELTVLDVGCGPGETDHFLTGRFGSVEGVDVSEEMVELARETNPDVRYHVYDGRTLPFPDGQFDLAFAVCVFHHVPSEQWPSLLAEMARVVARRGLVTVVEHNPLNPLTRLAVARCSFDDDVRLLARRTVGRLFAAGGLAVVERRYLIFFPWERPLLRRLEGVLRGLPLGAQHAVAGAPAATPPIPTQP